MRRNKIGGCQEQKKIKKVLLKKRKFDRVFER